MIHRKSLPDGPVLTPYRAPARWLSSASVPPTARSAPRSVDLRQRHRFTRPIYPVNPKYPGLQGLRCCVDIITVVKASNQ